MKSIMYKSVPAKNVDKKAFQEFLELAQRKNQENNITGCIFLSKNKIIQLLEGEDQTIDALFSRIKKDNRHTGIITLVDKKIDRRTMANWSMSIIDFWSDFENKFDELQLITTLYQSTDIELIKAFQEEVLS